MATQMAAILSHKYDTMPMAWRVSGISTATGVFDYLGSRDIAVGEPYKDIRGKTYKGTIITCIDIHTLSKDEYRADLSVGWTKPKKG